MKQVILGVYGIFLMVAMTMLGLTVYGMQSRENEMNNCLSRIVMDTLEENYVPHFLQNELEGKRDDEVAAELKRRIGEAIHTDSEVEINVICCDTKKGILSVAVTESYNTPLGIRTEREYRRTAIVDRRE
ncbi:MAG: hypothetical protein PUF45_05570 [Lachnospiraceae bacterium]|nr:hypothetical protein [Lachnospiraceae bacterium]